MDNKITKKPSKNDGFRNWKFKSIIGLVLCLVCHSERNEMY